MLQNKTVVITGAGSGLGRALALAFCQEGCHVFGLGRSAETLTETQQQAGEAFSFYVADIANFSEVSAAVAQIQSQTSSIDYWFNNAAVYPKVSFLEESADDFAQAMAININGTANGCKAVLPVMIKQGFGRIFNVGTWADLAPIAESAAYSASKGALHGLTKAIAADLASVEGDIQIHEWIPGHLNTQMSGYTGIAPAISAGWAVAIVKSQPDKPNAIFEQDREWTPPKSLKQKLMFWK